MRLSPLVVVLGLLGLAVPTIGAAQENAPVAEPSGVDSGAFLAARVAMAENDFAAALVSYNRALISDPANADLLEGAALSHVAAGQMEQARVLTQQAQERGVTLDLALPLDLADLARQGDFAAILNRMQGDDDVTLLIRELSTGWAELGAGRMSEAQEAFDRLSGSPGVEAFGLFHKALALASVGDFEGADAILAGPAAASIHSLRRGVIAHAQVLSQLERNPDAVALIDQIFVPGRDPVITSLRARLAAGEPVPFDVTRTAADGIAEVFFTLATALNGEVEDTQTLIYARLATWVRPDHAEAQLLTAGLLDQLRQYDLATQAYAQVSPQDPAFRVAERGRAESLARSGNIAAAIEALTALSRAYPQDIEVFGDLADLLRRENKFEAAIAAYDAAIALLGPTPSARDWPLFYARGVAQERQKRWPLAEADFRRALELQPDQAQVLNYMGYSFLEMNQNLDEALSMIERAVAADPEQGYILDSLAWGYYLVGRYDDAVAPMERASLLEPVDPVVTDHLGDVYWAVGRKLEAEFQWHRALSFKPAETDATRIRRKLDIGLDAVRAEEGKPPIEAQTTADAN